jgi:hypothetical protein
MRPVHAQVLWDALFADHHISPGESGLQFVEYLCLAMLIYVRADLLSKDNMGCLRRLMKYPPVENISLLVTSACSLRDPAKPPEIPQTPTPISFPPPAAPLPSPPAPPAHLFTPSPPSSRPPPPPSPPPAASAHPPLPSQAPPQSQGQALSQNRPPQSDGSNSDQRARWSATVDSVCSILESLQHSCGEAANRQKAAEAHLLLTALRSEFVSSSAQPAEMASFTTPPPATSVREPTVAASPPRVGRSPAKAPLPAFIGGQVVGARSVQRSEGDGVGVAPGGGVSEGSAPSSRVGAGDGLLRPGGGVVEVPKESDADRKEREKREKEEKERIDKVREEKEREEAIKAERRRAALGALLEPPSPAVGGLKSSIGEEGSSKGSSGGAVSTSAPEAEGATSPSSERLFKAKGRLQKESLFGDTDVSSWLTPAKTSAKSEGGLFD